MLKKKKIFWFLPALFSMEVWPALTTIWVPLACNFILSFNWGGKQNETRQKVWSIYLSGFLSLGQLDLVHQSGYFLQVPDKYPKVNLLNHMVVLINSNRVLPRKCTGHNKHPLPTTQSQKEILQETKPRIFYHLSENVWKWSHLVYILWRARRVFMLPPLQMETLKTRKRFQGSYRAT